MMNIHRLFSLPRFLFRDRGETGLPAQALQQWHVSFSWLLALPVRTRLRCTFVTGPRMLRSDPVGDGPKDDFDLNAFELFGAEFENLVESFLPDLSTGLLIQTVLPLDGRRTHRSLAAPSTGLVADETGFERNLEEEDDAGDAKAAGQRLQLPSGLGSESSGVYDAEAIDAQALFDETVHQGEGLRLEALVALVVANERADLVGRDDLCRPKATRGERRLP